MDEAHARGDKQMLLEVICHNNPAVHFYEKFGFTKTHRYMWLHAWKKLCRHFDPEREHAVIRVLVSEEGNEAALLNALFAKYPEKIWHVPAFFPEE